MDGSTLRLETGSTRAAVEQSRTHLSSPLSCPPSTSSAQLSADLKTIRVIDFGIAKRTDANGAFVADTWATPPYAAPEQVRGDRLCTAGAVDAYAFGLVLMRLLYPQLSAHQLARHLDGPPRHERRDDWRERERERPEPLPPLSSAHETEIARVAVALARQCRSERPADRPGMAPPPSPVADEKDAKAPAVVRPAVAWMPEATASAVELCRVLRQCCDRLAVGRVVNCALSGPIVVADIVCAYAFDRPIQ
jgi:serine/threonine protein kinase